MKKNYLSETSRNTDAAPLKEVIDNFLKVHKLNRKYSETYLINSWERMMGTTIAKRTTSIKISKGVMYVELNSSALKNELSMSKSKIMKWLEEELGERWIDDIVFF